MSESKDAKCQGATVEIFLESPSKVFFSGETITGFVKFTTEADREAQMLSIHLNAEYYWPKAGEEVTELLYKENCSLDLMGAGEGNRQMPFSIAVRPDSPTSIASPLGGIRYRLACLLLYKEGEEVLRAEAEEGVSVNKERRLAVGGSGRKVSRQDGTSLAPCCCGVLAADLEVCSTWLLCGQSAIINACVTNGSRSLVRCTSVALVQKLVRQRDRKSLKSTVAARERGPIQPGGRKQVWLSERFLIPPLPPTSDGAHFAVKYKLALTIRKASSKCVRLSVPVVIGNLPPLNGPFKLDQEQIEARCSNLFADLMGFKPLYVSYVT